MTTHHQPHQTVRRRAAFQMGYAALFADFVLWPNLRMAPNLVAITGAALTAVWLIGGLAAWVKLPRADELLLCGAAAPLLVGLTQLAYRVDFVRIHGALTRPGVEGDSMAMFAAVWGLELALVLVPGIFFVWWNARALGPVD